MSGSRNSVHFDSLEEFYLRTREDSIDALCREIRSHLDKWEQFSLRKNPGETASWKRSLPDLAELLYDPAAYRDRVKEDGERLRDAMDVRIKALKEFSSNEDLRRFVMSETYADLASVFSGDEVRKGLDRGTLSSMEDMRNAFLALGGSGIADITERLEEQRNKLDDALNKLPKRPGPCPFDGVQVDVEYPVRTDNNTKKRIDVLLSDPEKGKYAIIELKQWTEDSISVSFSEEDDPQKCLVNVFSWNRSQIHPVMKVRDEYKKMLKAELGEDITVYSFVYLHNQMYKDGQLFSIPKANGLDIYEDREGVMFTRLYYSKMLKRLKKLFGPEKDGKSKTE